MTARLSRAFGRPPAPGLVVVSGGKYTTYRVMAADAVDAAVAAGQLHAIACRTARIPLLGARGWDQAWAGREQLAAGRGLPLDAVEHLLHRYGSLVGEVLEAVDADPTLAHALGGGAGGTAFPSGGPGGGLGGAYLRAEVAHAVTHEGARHLEDVLVRRTRLAMETAGAAGPAGRVPAGDWAAGDWAAGDWAAGDWAAEVARIMAPLLGWDEAAETAEVDDYRCQCRLQARAAAEAADDAEVARMIEGVPTLLPLP